MAFGSRGITAENARKIGKSVEPTVENERKIGKSVEPTVENA